MPNFMPEYSVWKPADELALGLDEVERDAAQLGERGDDEHDEADELRHHVPEAALRLDDVDQAERCRPAARRP